MRSNIRIGVLVFTAVVCYLTKSDARSSGSDGIYFEDTSESPSYLFGSEPGVITYRFPEDERPDIRNHTIVIRFKTSKPDAILLRIISEFDDDYVGIYLVSGTVYATYKIPIIVHLTRRSNVKVNDNVYHVVKLQGPGLNMQVDNNLEFTSANTKGVPKNYASQLEVQIGGNPNKNGIDRSFSGVITEATVNGIRILQLAAENDNHTTIRGDVQRVSDIHYTYPQRKHREIALTRPRNNDLIFSGSGCNEDDEDECTTPATEGDDLITPVYVPRRPIRPQFTTVSPNKSNKTTLEPCDDEDCFIGSGSGDGSGGGSGDHEFTTISTATEISEETIFTQVWSNINQPKPQTSSTTSSTPALTSNVDQPTTSIPFTSQFTSISPDQYNASETELCDLVNCTINSVYPEISESYEGIDTTSAVTGVSTATRKLPEVSSESYITTTTLPFPTTESVSRETASTDVTVENSSDYSPPPDVELSEDASYFTTPKTIALVSGILIGVLIVVVTVIVIVKLTSQKDTDNKTISV